MSSIILLGIGVIAGILMCIILANAKENKRIKEANDNLMKYIK